jgi:hypothetical protein
LSAELKLPLPTSIPSCTAEETRYEMACILKRAHPPKPTITGRERAALREFKNKDICTVLADKDNATVILDSSDYSNKIHTLLADPTYEPTNCNPLK